MELRVQLVVVGVVWFVEDLLDLEKDEEANQIFCYSLLQPNNCAIAELNSRIAL